MTDTLDIVTLFKQAAFEAEGRHLEGLTLDSKLSELAMDSVAVMETIGVFEQRVGIRFADEDLSRLTCLRDLQALVEKARRVA
ncbi:MAG TPA: acyl carrier protein [Kofleriaceae bacterium]|nr:acyl carrier protein [Kofleriaceae bacterium]